jgi:hypothetical protein
VARWRYCTEETNRETIQHYNFLRSIYDASNFVNKFGHSLETHTNQVKQIISILRALHQSFPIFDNSQMQYLLEPFLGNVWLSARHGLFAPFLYNGIAANALTFNHHEPVMVMLLTIVFKVCCRIPNDSLGISSRSQLILTVDLFLCLY